MENGDFSCFNLILFQAEFLQTGILLYFIITHIVSFVIVDVFIFHFFLSKRYYLNKVCDTLLAVCSLDGKIALLALGFALKKFLNPLIKLYFINLLLSISYVTTGLITNILSACHCSLQLLPHFHSLQIFSPLH